MKTSDNQKELFDKVAGNQRKVTPKKYILSEKESMALVLYKAPD